LKVVLRCWDDFYVVQRCWDDLKVVLLGRRARRPSYWADGPCYFALIAAWAAANRAIGTRNGEQLT